jgi:hypothetical protein
MESGKMGEHFFGLPVLDGHDRKQTFGMEGNQNETLF